MAHYFRHREHRTFAMHCLHAISDYCYNDLPYQGALKHVI